MTKKYFYFQNKQNNESSASTDVMAPQGPYLNIIKRKKRTVGTTYLLNNGIDAFF